jgi:amidase
MKKQTRREFLQMSAAGLAVAGLSGSNAISQSGETDMDLLEITVADLRSKMRSGELSAVKLVERYTERIKRVDPKILSVVEINPDAIRIAEKLDKEQKNGKTRSPLHGIPILIKDNIETADDMKTTAGSLALLDAPAPVRDAFVVERLRKAGVVILGKTNLSEWANFRSTKSISGWSGRGGQTNNPYILDKNPCGSSAGTGAAISANLAAIGIGTETNGSIICPSLRCGLVGIKPTLGLVSRSGIIPIAETQDTAGPMARNVSDAAILLGIMIGKDKHDPVTAAAGKNGKKDYTAFLDKQGLKGARIGVARQFIDNKTPGGKLAEQNLAIMKDLGAIMVDVSFPVVQGFSDMQREVLLYEFKEGLNKYLAGRGAKYKTLADLIKFNEDNKEKEMPIFGQELFLEAEKRGEATKDAYLKALQTIKKTTRQDGIDAAIEKEKLDAICAPAGGSTWSIAAVAGYPYITVPAGFIDGLPAGMGFFGAAFSEAALIKYAYAFEQATKKREAPKFLPKST